MENHIEIFTTESLTTYENDYHFCGHERQTFEEIVLAIKTGDTEKIQWLGQFGGRLHHILLNVMLFEEALGSVLRRLGFDEYGWLKRAVFLNQESLEFGLKDKSRYGDYSTITLGHGPNGLWAYGMSVSYGTAGSACGISVYGEAFPSTVAALDAVLKELQSSMQKHVGDSDTMNYIQKVILATLKDIEAMKVAKVQLSLF